MKPKVELEAMKLAGSWTSCRELRLYKHVNTFVVANVT